MAMRIRGDMSAKAGDPLDRLKSQRSKHDEAEQISILRRSSTIKRRSRHSSSNSHRHPWPLASPTPLPTALPTCPPMAATFFFTKSARSKHIRHFLTLPNLSQRIFPSYVSSATLWSDLLASGLAPPSSGSQPFSSDTPATRQEAIKKWRMCLERADLVKKKVAAMGGS
jgi:hypothetical protein